MLRLCPKIHELVRAALQSGQGLVCPREGSCELYGFDVLVDEMYDPHLLEVNLSPALNHRTPHLTQTIGQMVEGMLMLTADAAEGGSVEEREREQAVEDLSWRCVYQESAKVADARPCRQGSKFAVQGKGASKLSLRTLERYTTMNHAAYTIRRAVAMTAQRRIARRRLENKASTRLQQKLRAT